MSADKTKRCDALLYRSEQGDRLRVSKFFNLISNALTYGMTMGSARTGLGTDTPVGPSIPGESLYYQALHAYSAFDWEFEQRLLSDIDTGPLPTEIAILAGRFSRAFVDGFSDEQLDEVTTAQRIACTLAPSLQPFEFRRLEKIDQSLAPGPMGVKFSRTIRQQLWEGSAAKLEAIAEHACHAATADLQEKLATMASAFTPLSTVFAASFDPKDAKKSYTRMAVYLPALHTLHAEDVDDPSTWYLERGLAPLALPTPVQVSAASITHLCYLRDADRTRQQGIELEVRRDFSDPQRVTMVLGFGRLFAKDSEDLLGFDCSDHRDALYLLLRAHLPDDEADTERTRAAKERFNRTLGGFEIEARIHQLTLHLQRDDPSKKPDEEQLLRPQFSLDESRLSFRIQRHTESTAERLSLMAAGFTCDPVADGAGFVCWREFWTWDRLRAFFGGEDANAGGLGRMLVTGRERLLGQAVGRATKVVLDHSIESIEKSLDQEMARIVSDALARYATAREVLAHRLHRGLFDE